MPIQWGGQGRPLLYLHDAWGQLGDWQPGSHLARLAERYLVLAPSHPGYHGATGQEQLDDGLDLALYYLDFLDELQLESPYVVGHGLGGLIAAEMATLAPRDIAKLVLIAPYPIALDEEAGPDILSLEGEALSRALWTETSSVPVLLADATLRERRQASLELARRYLPADGGRRLTRRLHRLAAPTLLVWGERDGIVSSRAGQLLCERIALGRLVVLPDAAHVPQIEQGESYTQAVLDFFAT